MTPRLPSFIQERQSVHGPSGNFLDLLPPASLPPVQKRDAQHMFLQHKGAHTDIFIAHQADSHESLGFPIRANHPIRANRANRFARITPLRDSLIFRVLEARGLFRKGMVCLSHGKPRETRKPREPRDEILSTTPLWGVKHAGKNSTKSVVVTPLFVCPKC